MATICLMMGIYTVMVTRDMRELKKTLASERNQSSKLLEERDASNTRYDDLVESIRLRASEVERPKPRQARNFSEFRDAVEHNVRPRGMKGEKWD